MDRDENFQKTEFIDSIYLLQTVRGFVEMEDLSSQYTLPISGVTGRGNILHRRENNGVWFSGTLLTPNFEGGNTGYYKSHMEGIITDSGDLRALEFVYDFPSYDGDCFEYVLKAKDIRARPVIFSGNLTYRAAEDFGKTRKERSAILEFNGGWFSGKSTRILTRHYKDRDSRHGLPLPEFWEQFLGEIEESGYEHPYNAITNALQKERLEKDDLPF